MVDDVRLTVAGRRPVDFYGRTGGVIPTPVEVLAKLEAMNLSLIHIYARHEQTGPATGNRRVRSDHGS